MSIQFQSLSQDGMGFLTKVLALDWEPVSNRLMAQGFTREKVKVSLWKYACFLTLTYIYPCALVPSQLIDDTHHAFISDPIHYEQEMKQLNHFVEHVPYVKGQYFNNEGFLHRFNYTKLLFRENFDFEMIAEEDRGTD
ncbi:MAG: hypothetical protein AAGA83_00185, partial [Cyanobacteria bacterium P01_F01_bin.116]